MHTNVENNITNTYLLNTQFYKILKFHHVHLSLFLRYETPTEVNDPVYYSLILSFIKSIYHGFGIYHPHKYFVYLMFIYP